MRSIGKTAWSVGPVLAVIFAPIVSTLPTLARHRVHDVSRVIDTNEPAFATFQVGCSGCLGGEPNSDVLTIDLAISHSDEACEGQNITINGQSLLQPSSEEETWKSDGLVSFQALLGSAVHNVTASWKSQCTAGDDVPTVDEARKQVSTHTLSMSLIEVDQKPTTDGPRFSITIDRSPLVEGSDLGPGASFHLVDQLQFHSFASPWSKIELVDVDTSEPAAIKKYKEELRLMEQHSKALKHSIKQLQRVLTVHNYEHSPSLEEQIKQCPDAKCAVKAISDKAHGAMKLMYYKLQAHHNHHHLGQKVSSLWRTAGQQYDRHAAVVDLGDLPEHHHILLKTLSLLIPMLLLIVLLHRCCNSPSRRAERRWARESRRNANAIARAHRKEACRVWFRSLFRSRRSVELAEKQVMVSSQEAILEDAVQAEIRDLRSAAEFVTALTCSSNTASSSVRSPVPTPLTLASSNLTSPRPPPGRPESLPDYRSEAGYSDGAPPPDYEDDADDNSEFFGAVADGFQYRNRRMGSMNTPDSSVVSTSPRWSAEVEYIPPKDEEA